MNKTNIKIGLQDDAYELFSATRVIYCTATKCIFNNGFNSKLECTLKRININDEGKCGSSIIEENKE
jgi:hypothetical protein